MKKIIDNFSKQSDTYKKYRPTYPDELYESFLPLIQNKNECWDCGTGNGQVASKLSNYFKNVYASDISENQIKIAEQKSNITYEIQRAEKTNYEANKFDLITVGQAVHWFDIKSFTAEVKRVSKPNGVLVIWGYDLLKIEKKVDKVIDKFYNEIVGPYWNEERKHIDNKYDSIEFDFTEIKSPKNLSINASWKFEDLIGFLNSWSSVQNYIKENKGLNPVNQVYEELKMQWEGCNTKEVRFPVFMKIGVIEK